MANKPMCYGFYESRGECYAYFNRIFNDIRYYLYQNKDMNIKFQDKIDTIYKIDKIDKFNKISDPILKHIAIYLIANYYEAQEYFSEDGKWQNNPACESLNKWMDNRKSYFTLALHCKGNVHLWNQTIEPLWEELVKKSKFGNLKNNVNKKWCERHNFFRGHLELPKGLPPPMCYKHVPIGYECVLPIPPTMCNLENTCKNDHVRNYYKKCKDNNVYGNDFTDYSKMFAEAIANGNSLFKSIDDITFLRQVKKNVDCPSLKYSTHISFTPLGSKLSYGGINKKRLRDNFNEELEYEEYARSMNKNPHRALRRNNIYYHSVRN